MRHTKLLLAASAAVLAIPVLLIAQERIDLSIVHRIRAEAFENSKVMEHLFWLTDVNGPRVQSSPNYVAACNWAVKQLQEYGLSAKLEKWGPFGRGWTYTHFEAHILEPQYAPIIGFPLAWSPGTNGTVTGEPMQAIINTEADIEKFKGKLKGKIVLVSPLRDLAMHLTPDGKRYTDDDLAKEALAPEPGQSLFRMGPPSGQPGAPRNMMQMRELRNKINKFFSEEAPAVVVQSGTGASDEGTVFGSQAGSRDKKDPLIPPTIVIAPEHYNRLIRLLDHKVPVKLAINVEAKMIDDSDDSVQVISELEGGKKKDEIVMLGAHFDSWQGGTGATDNGVGSAVMIEAMRILKEITKQNGVKLDRTVRLGLWGGEEEGLLGSRAYVKEHFADPEKMKTTEEHAKIAGYFNYDNGSGKIRGIYLQGNDMARPIFEKWIEPFKDLGVTTVTIRNTGGTDHQSFDAVGLPGFQFIQDPLEYNARTHHSNMDVYDRAQKGDLMQAAAVIASFAYNTAMRDEMLPRKPLPKPRPNRMPF